MSSNQGDKGVPEARVSLLYHDAVEFTALYRWLIRERDLQGSVRVASHGPADGELGSAPDVITVALGSGGVGMALAGSLTAWIQSRRSHVSIKVTARDRSIEISADTVEQVRPILTDVLRSVDEPEAS